MQKQKKKRIGTGIPGLDEILHGGFLPSRAYLVNGASGTGKTIFGLHFLTATGDGSNLFISFTQPEAHLRQDAEAIGIQTKDIVVLDMTAEAEIFAEVQSYDIFSPVEVEREPIAKAMRARIEEVKPLRIFIDGFSELRMISSDMFHFLRTVQSFFRFATTLGSTVLVSATEGLTDIDIVLQSTADGVIHLGGRSHLRSLEVVKMRGSDFAPGPHPMRITSAGLEVFPEADQL